MNFPSQHGWIIIDKPAGITSAAVVGKVKRMLGQKKVGHAGTLDPMATGILPLALGEATKTVDYVMTGEKTYEFTVKWGSSTTTDDKEGEILENTFKRPTQEEILNILPQFEGNILQLPPLYSALHVEGKRAYDLAREGKTLEDLNLKRRPIEIFSLELLATREDEADFIAHCSKGTYVRSLGRDMARTLGTLGHLTALRRTQSGKFNLSHAISLEHLSQLRHSSAKLDQIWPINAVLDDIPAVVLDQDQERLLRFGQTLNLRNQEEGAVLCISPIGLPIALAEVTERMLKSKRIFNIS